MDPTLRLADLLLTYSPTRLLRTKIPDLMTRNRAYCRLLRNAIHKLSAAAFYLNVST